MLNYKVDSEAKAKALKAYWNAWQIKVDIDRLAAGIFSIVLPAKHSTDLHIMLWRELNDAFVSGFIAGDTTNTESDSKDA